MDWDRPYLKKSNQVIRAGFQKAEPEAGGWASVCLHGEEVGGAQALHLSSPKSDVSLSSSKNSLTAHQLHASNWFDGNSHSCFLFPRTSVPGLVSKVVKGVILFDFRRPSVF